MRRRQWLIAAVALAAAPAVAHSQDGQELPPGHPPIDGPSPKPPGELPSGHPPVNPGSPARSADQLLNQLDSAKDLKQRAKTFEIAASIGRLYYTRSRFSDAAEYLGQALEKAEPARQLFLRERKKTGAKAKSESAGCPKAEDDSLEHQTATAKMAAKEGRHPAALACLQSSLQPVLEISELRGNALFLIGNAGAAAEQYNRVLEVSDERPESLFGHAAVLLDSKGDDPSALRRAKADWEKYLRLYPTAAKAPQAKLLLAQVEQALGAGGITRLSQQRALERKSKAPAALAEAPRPSMAGTNAPPPLTQEMIDAVRNTERTPELEQGLAKLVQEGEEHLAHARFQEALDVYKRVVPFQPENGRAKAGMAWALVGLNRQPMAERVWSVAVQADPASVDKLGETLIAKGDKQGAKALWTKLARTAPEYAQQAGLKNKLTQ